MSAARVFVSGCGFMTAMFKITVIDMVYKGKAICLLLSSAACSSVIQLDKLHYVIWRGKYFYF